MISTTESLHSKPETTGSKKDFLDFFGAAIAQWQSVRLSTDSLGVRYTAIE